MFEVSNKILCVDDQIEITQLLDQQLRGRYQVAFANSAADALQLIASQGPFAVMLVDFAMPDMDGIALLREVRIRAPETVPIMLTAFADISVAVSALHDANIFRFVRKPWDADQLKVFIDDALERYRISVSERSLASSLEKINRRLYERAQELEAVHKTMNRRLSESPTVIFEARPGNGVLQLEYVSPNFVQLTGIEVSECLATSDPWQLLIDAPDQKAAVERMLAAPTDETLLHHGEYSLRCRDGRRIRVHAAFRKLAGHDGEPEIIGSWTRIDGAAGQAN